MNKNFELCNWFVQMECDKGASIDVLSENYGVVASMKILRQTEKAVYVSETLKNRAGAEWENLRWYPKSAFAYANFPEFKQFRADEIEKLKKIYKKLDIDCGVRAMTTLSNSKSV